MRIRNATAADLPRIMEIYAHAREYMAAHGNPNQWGGTNWPPEDLIREDIELGKSFVCENDSNIVGVFFFDQGKDIEPTYRTIEEGEWLSDEPYGVIHRIASDGSAKGVGAFCFSWAYAQCPHLRADTHPDNRTMQNLLTKLGFEKRGVIHVIEDDHPRYAYELIKERQKMRRMTAEDKPYVLGMMRKFYRSDAIMTNGSEEIFANDIEECVSDSPFLEGFVFPDEEGEVKGYAMIAHSYSTEFGRHCIWIEDLYLESELRGTGLASEFFDYLKTRYPDSINRLEVEAENERAIKAYSRNGFEEIPYLEMIRFNDTNDTKESR